MHITLDRRTLTRALTAAQAVADRASPMPALGHVLLRADASGLTVCATDLVLALRSIITGETKETGSLAAPAKDLLRLLSAMTAEHVTLHAVDGLRLAVAASRSTYHLPCLSARDFPAISDEPAPQAWQSVNTPAIHDLLRLAAHAICSDETRHHMCGVHLVVADGIASAEATDGHRLAVIHRPFAADPCDVILPQRAVTAALKLLGAADSEADDERCSIALTPRDWWLRVGDSALSVRPVEGEFPPLRDLVSRSSARTITVGRQDLAAALARVAILDDSMRLVVTAGECNTITLRARSDEGGDGEEIIDAQIGGGSDAGVEVGLNVAYTADAVGVFTSTRIAIECSDAFAPVLLRGVYDAGEHGRRDGAGDSCIIMPVRL